MSAGRRSAVIDLGSNSVRMMVVEIGRRSTWRVVDEERAILRLGDALARRGVIAQDLERALFVFASLAERARRMGAQQIAAVGTAALRSARDGAAFSAALSRAAGVSIDIIDGAEEARLGFLGAMHTLDVPEGNLADVGGASTEISHFSDRRLRSAASAQVGAVTLARKELGTDPPTREELLSASRVATEALHAAMPQPQEGLPLVALGGSFRSIAKMHRARVGYPFPSLHNYRFAPAAVQELLEEIQKMGLRQRLRVPGLAAHRAETTVAALTLAQVIMQWLRPSEIVISGSGLREGILFDRILPGGGRVPQDAFPQSVQNLLFQIGEQADEDLVAALSQIFSALSPLCPEPDSPRIAQAAAHLRGIGKRVNYYDRHLHTFNLVTSARLFGLTHRQQLMLAAAAAYEGPRRMRDLLLPFERLLERADILQAQRIGLLVAYAEAIGRLFPGERPEITGAIQPARIDLRIAGVHRPPDMPFDEAGRLEDQFLKVFGRKIVAHYVP